LREFFALETLAQHAIPKAQIKSFAAEAYIAQSINSFPG
jgi:hypothetical protein